MRAIAVFMVLFFATSASASEPDDFARWLESVKAEAVKRGFKESTVRALDSVQHIPRVLELDRGQPEKKLTFEQYRAIVVSPERVERGRALLAEHREVLERVAERFGVQPEFIVALWGTETKYGTITGSYPLLSALATLAHDGRRSAYFRHELFNALRILDQGHIAPEAMLGSWAGAMGQCQFMPSTFLRHAADFDGDGRKDIWGTQADVFASAGQFLSRLGWKRGEPWGHQVTLPAKLDDRLFDKKLAKTNRQWRALGVKSAAGGTPEAPHRKATLIRPGGDDGPAYLVHANYHVLLGWNRSKYFATAVGLLADALVAPSPPAPQP